MQKFFSICLLISFMLVPMAAADTEYVSRDTFWNWAAGSNGVIKQVINFVGGLGTCSKSEDTYHHASSYFDEGNVSGEVRYRCICDYCGDSFTAYASDLQQSYDAQVSELPAQMYGADGYLRFAVNHLSASVSSGSLLSFTGGSSFNAAWSGTSATLSVAVDSFVAPISGDYCLAFYYSSSNSNTVPSAFPPSGFGTGYNFLSSSPSLSTIPDSDSSSLKAGKYFKFPRITAFTVGSQVFGSGTFRLQGAFVNTTYTNGYLEVLCKPIESTGDTYNIESRPGVILGMYGDVNGNAFSNNSLSIVNETNKTYTNPATGKTDTIKDWSYNYEDRSYTLTLGGGTTTTVTYGDENVTIKEGDTVYNIYYLVDGSGTDAPDPGPPSPGRPQKILCKFSHWYQNLTQLHKILCGLGPLPG